MSSENSDSSTLQETSASSTMKKSSHSSIHFSIPLSETYKLFTRPIQRQRWGDTQIHPVVNWGDLFFDLFYVGAAYNLGYIIVYDTTKQGLLYFCGAFLPVMQMWMDKTFYDARFFTRDDLYHRFYEIVHLGALATAVVHIRPVKFLSNPEEHIDMFGMSLGFLAANVLSIGRQLEVYFWVDGGPEAKTNSKRDMYGKVILFAFYLASTIIAGTKYFQNQASDSTGRMLAGDEEVLSTYETESSASTDLPIWLLLAGSLAWLAFFVILIIFLLPGGGAHKRVIVPANISFTIHRYGEWTMLLLGESVLSLLIVDVLDPSGEYYLTFYAGVLSVVLLQYMHFRSQPHDPDDHALRRSKEQGILFSVLITIYSGALILIGTAYKMLVSEHAIAAATAAAATATGDDKGRTLLFAPIRILAGGDDSGLSTEERRQAVANLFCYSMAVVWLTNDLMMINHNGLTGNIKRCVCKESHKWSYPGIALIMSRIGLIVFIATLRGYVTDPTTLSLIGLAGISAQVVLRVIGSLVFPSDQVHNVDTQGLQVPNQDVEENKWPNVTHAVAEQSEEIEAEKEIDVE